MDKDKFEEELMALLEKHQVSFAWLIFRWDEDMSIRGFAGNTVDEAGLKVFSNFFTEHQQEIHAAVIKAMQAEAAKNN